jgi:hypothetical protein
MPAGAFQVYRPSIGQIGQAGIRLDQGGTPRFRMTLVTASYTPSVTLHDTWSDVSANEVANGGGYTTHGKLLAATWTAPGSPGLWTFDVDDQSWTSSTITAKYAVIVQDADANGALAAGDLVLCYCDLETGGGSVSTTNGTFAINIAAAGVFTLEQA